MARNIKLTKNEEQRWKQIRKVYDGLPKVACKGLCDNSCGPVPATRLERKIINLPVLSPGFIQKSADEGCPRLKDKRCSQYEDRPILCRLWGIVDDPMMRCTHGCEVERLLTKEESHAVLDKIESLGH